MNYFDFLQTILNFFTVLYLHRFMMAFFDESNKKESKLLYLTYLIYPLLTTIVYKL
mgnify:CR=1 FL=1